MRDRTFLYGVIRDIRYAVRGGRVPQATVLHVTLRGYVRLFGS